MSSEQTWWNVLFVAVNQNNSITHLAVINNPVKFGSRFVNSIPVGGIDNKNEGLRSSEIMTPQRSDFVLSTDIPNIEFYVLVLNSFDVELKFE